MRKPFLSESKFIQSALKLNNIMSPVIGDVIEEYYAPQPDKGCPAFNSDFALTFAPFEKLENFKSCCVPILPNTQGTDLFVTCENNSGIVLRTELMDGGAFPLVCYEKYLALIESEFKEYLGVQRWRDWTYLRVFVIGSSVCLLALRNTATPSNCNPLETVHQSDTSTLGITHDERGLQCIDGWFELGD